MDRLVGKRAPYFEMNIVFGDGSDFGKVTLADFNGKWLIMFFYPLDFTFVCPTEITGFSKRYHDFKKLGAEILSVSIDSEYSHQAWINTPREKGGLGRVEFLKLFCRQPFFKSGDECFVVAFLAC